MSDLTIVDLHNQIYLINFDYKLYRFYTIVIQTVQL